MDEKIFLQDLRTIVNMESGSSIPGGTAKVAAWLKGEFEKSSLWHTEYIDVGAPGGPCLKVTGGKGEKYRLLLMAHMDTVFPEGTLKERPFRREGDFYYGPGCHDMKGGDIFALHLARWLETKPHLLENHAICFLFNPDEELSSIYSRPVIEELAKKSDYAFVLEPSMEENTLVKGRRGVARFYLDFHGIASHAGSAPEKGASAIHEFIRWGEILLKENKPCEGTNLNIGMVSGGTAANIIADHCSCSVDMRMTDIRKGEHLEELLHDLASRPFDLRVLTTIRGGITRPPYGNPDMEELLAREVTAYFALKGKEIHWKTVGSASDGNFTSALGVPTIDALGPMGGGAHTPGEYGVVHDILPKFEILTELTAYVLEK